MSGSGSQLNDLRSYSRHWLGEFIDLYQTEQCLWQPKHPDYSNHNERNKAYDKLVEKLKEVEPMPDRAMVVRKINSLRSAFRREYRKSTSKANYETRLWYYDKLLFIADQNPKRPSNGVIDIKPAKRTLTFEEDDSMEFETEDHQMDGTVSQTEQTEPTTTCVTLVKNEEQHQQTAQTDPLGPESLHHTHQQQQHHHHHHQQQHQQQQQQNVGQSQEATQHNATVKVLEITSLDSNSQQQINQIQQAVSSLEHQHHMQQHLQQHQTGGTTTAQIAQLHHSQVPTIQIAREHLQPLFGNSTFSTATATHRQEDEYDAVGFNVASKLRVMTPTQRIIAEKLIGDVLFNGQLDNLSINSTLSH